MRERDRVWLIRCDERKMSGKKMSGPGWKDQVRVDEKPCGERSDEGGKQEWNAEK